MAKKWLSEFRFGPLSKSGRPIEVTASETLEKIQGMVLVDGRLKVCMEVTGILQG